MKKKQKRNRLLFVVFVVAAVLFMYYRNNLDNYDIKVVSKIDDYNYNLDSNETRIYKKYFKELKNILDEEKKDEEEYAKLISKLFVIDFYTLTNKITNQDVGGLQFIHSGIRDNFYSKAVNTIYKYIKSNLYKNRHQLLPEVKDVEIKEIESIKYNENEFNDDTAYLVKLKINYIRNLDYPDELIIRIIHEDNKLSIIEVE